MKERKLTSFSDNYYSGEQTIYEIEFNNLTDLYDYLKNNPEVNPIFENAQSSLNGTHSFAGSPLEKSIEYCISGYKQNFDKFLTASNELKKVGKDESDNRKLSRSLYGGIPLAPLVASGVPDCMLRYNRDTETKYVNIYFNLAYPAFTEEVKIVNRGLATLNLIQTLEDRGYIVNFKAFELSYCGDEAINFIINLKKPSDLFLNIEKCYFPLVAREFLRRILFRVLESSQVKNYSWNSGYGRPASINDIKKFFKTTKNDLIISDPSEMNINGKNIYYDTFNLINKLEIEKEFNIDKIKKLAKDR